MDNNFSHYLRVWLVVQKGGQMNEKALKETVNAIMTIATKNNLDVGETLSNLCTSVQCIIQLLASRHDYNPENIARWFSESVKEGVKAPTGELKKLLKEQAKVLIP